MQNKPERVYISLSKNEVWQSLKQFQELLTSRKVKWLKMLNRCGIAEFTNNIFSISSHKVIFR